MRRVFFIFFIFLIDPYVTAQVVEPVTTGTEQQLENLTANNDDVETEDDGLLQQMLQYARHPLNLNTADETALKYMGILGMIQIRNLIAYRELMGNLVDVHELQCVPGWDIATIQKLRPYIIVSNKEFSEASIKERLKKGEHSLLLRASQVLERSRGYHYDSAATNYYPGSPQKILVRYKYAYKHLLQYGVVAEKDAGEQFFKGRQRTGFDFYSAHVFMRQRGMVRSLAIGDFTVNLGQGLILWQSLAFRKSSDVMRIRRESDVLRPYNSAGEVNFQRGIGVTLGSRKWELSVFGSYRNLDANLVDDTSDLKDHVSSLQTSGYHRTRSEADDKAVQRQLCFGGNLSFRNRSLDIGLNAVHFNFKYPLIRSPDPYNRFAIYGNRFSNFSLDYSYTLRNAHFFGEAAVSLGSGKAFVNGLMLSASSRVDVSLLHRHISSSYHALYASAFTESSNPSNESGLYLGIAIKPGNAWRLDAYADLFRFPWLRYRVDAPSRGSDYMLQLQYKPGKQVEILSQVQFKTKMINQNPGQQALSPVVQQPRKNWRVQLNFKPGPDLELRYRTELVWFGKQDLGREEGFTGFLDILYRPLRKPFSGSLRLQYFGTGGYDSRVYAYEQDVLFSFSVPVLYDKGYRYYINLNYDINKKLEAWIRWSQTIYSDKTLIGSGLDEVDGNTRSEVKLQFMYKF